MLYGKRLLVILIVITIVFLFVFFLLGEPKEEAVVKFFPIDEKIDFTDVGSNLEIYKNEDTYNIIAENWSKTNEKVYLRQNINLVFKNGFLIRKSSPWKSQTDWIVDKIEFPLIEDNSIYTVLSYHHAEIHHDEIITSKQAVTIEKLNVIYFENSLEAFKNPKNARQKEALDKLITIYNNRRNELLEKGIKELNINRQNYDIYDLDTFSVASTSNSKEEEKWQTILGGVWEGLYKFYIHGYSKDDLHYFSPSMPWILIDKNSTHILVIFQRSDGVFEKLLQEL